jgi:Flp pilus assembly pilin Flp
MQAEHNQHNRWSANDAMIATWLYVNNRVSDFRKRIEERGATSIEYALMVGLIAMGIITAVSAFKTKTATMFNTYANTMPG